MKSQVLKFQGPATESFIFGRYVLGLRVRLNPDAERCLGSLKPGIGF
jgi:hypothetical protein